MYFRSFRHSVPSSAVQVGSAKRASTPVARQRSPLNTVRTRKSALNSDTSHIKERLAGSSAASSA
jgi:hypothetical protein